MARSVPLSRFTSRVGGGSAFFVRPHSRFMNMLSKGPDATPPKKRQLQMVGILLILLSIIVPRPLSRFAATMEPGTVRMIVAICCDLFRLSFIAGLICFAIASRKPKQL